MKHPYAFVHATKESGCHTFEVRSKEELAKYITTIQERGRAVTEYRVYILAEVGRQQIGWNVSTTDAMDELMQDEAPPAEGQQPETEGPVPPPTQATADLQALDKILDGIFGALNPANRKPTNKPQGE